MKALSKVLSLGALGLGSYGLYKILLIEQLDHFSFKEFGADGLLLSVDLLKKLDEFRSRIGQRVLISPAPGALLRFNPEKKESQHFWLKGNAADIMLPDGIHLDTAYSIAQDVGFTGIGIGPEWKPFPGMHLDVRQTENNRIASWGYMKQNGEQVIISALDALMRA